MRKDIELELSSRPILSFTGILCWRRQDLVPELSGGLYSHPFTLFQSTSVDDLRKNSPSRMPFFSILFQRGFHSVSPLLLEGTLKSEFVLVSVQVRERTNKKEDLFS